MPFTFPNGSQYNLILLDTNVLSEISKDIKNTRSGFIHRFPPNKYAPCFSTYSLLELHKADKAYEAFCEFFSTYPCLLLLPYMEIIREEIRCYKSDRNPSVLSNAFAPNASNETYNLKFWLSLMWDNRNLVDEITKNANGLPEVAYAWEQLRRHPIEAYSKDYEETCLRDFLFSVDATWTTQYSSFSVDEFPGTRMMLFSHFSRVHKSKRALGANDVNDVMISSALPYMDAIITEKYQAEVIKQAKNKIPQLSSIETATLSEIRVN